MLFFCLAKKRHFAPKIAAFALHNSQTDDKQSNAEKNEKKKKNKTIALFHVYVRAIIHW